MRMGKKSDTSESEKGENLLLRAMNLLSPFSSFAVTWHGGKSFFFFFHCLPFFIPSGEFSNIGFLLLALWNSKLRGCLQLAWVNPESHLGRPMMSRASIKKCCVKLFPQKFCPDKILLLRFKAIKRRINENKDILEKKSFFFPRACSTTLPSESAIYPWQDVSSKPAAISLQSFQISGKARLKLTKIHKDDCEYFFSKLTFGKKRGKRGPGAACVIPSRLICLMFTLSLSLLLDALGWHKIFSRKNYATKSL